jgi:spore coat protein U-like protein
MIVQLTSFCMRVAGGAAALRAMLIGAALGAAVGQAAAQSCTISNSVASYGTVDILSGSAVDTTDTISASCTGTANQTVRLCVEFSPGQTNGSGNRRLAAGTERLVHEIYSDSSRSTIWGSWGLATTAYGLYPFGVTYDLALGGPAAQAPTSRRTAGSPPTSKTPDRVPTAGR